MKKSIEVQIKKEAEIKLQKEINFEKAIREFVYVHGLCTDCAEDAIDMICDNANELSEIFKKFEL